jgi:hypothetical protein
MPNMVDGSGRALKNSRYKQVAAGQTTVQISSSVGGLASDGIPGRDYISHLIITAASTAAPGAVTLFDGTTALVVHGWNATVAAELAQTIVINCIAESTKGFNITTGTSVSVVAVGRF